jgi:hypothetical protein
MKGRIDYDFWLWGLWEAEKRQSILYVFLFSSLRQNPKKRDYSSGLEILM